MKKHGAERHFVRPDGVYSTSVLQAIPGYQPVSNAYQVAQRFTAAPYFATALNGYQVSYLNGTLPLWERIKLRWFAMKERARAKLIAKRVAAVSSVPMLPSAPAIAQPDMTSASNRSYSAAPNEQMANVALQITAGMVNSGDDVRPPSVAITQSAYAAQVDPSVAAIPGQMASMIASDVPGVVADGGYRTSMNRFNGVRSWWWVHNNMVNR